MEVIFRRDPMIYDGEYANNGWLQEAPKPYTQLTWDNAILINPTTAKDMGLETEDEVEITVDGRKVTGGLWLTPGHPKNSDHGVPWLRSHPRGSRRQWAGLQRLQDPQHATSSGSPPARS